MSIPLENLDDTTYEELVRDALARIPVYAPRWTDRNKTDPGVTFIELFAWLIEMQIYSLNRIDDKSRLKFLKLLGVPRYITYPKPSEVDLTFELVEGDKQTPIPEGTLVASHNPETGEMICFKTTQSASLSPLTRTAKVHAVQEKVRKEFSIDGSRNLRIKLDESIFLLRSETIKNMLKVWVNGTEWYYREYLDASGNTDRHFTADIEFGTITFGDGVHGRIPSKGMIIVEHSSALGSRGNVVAGTINKILDDVLASVIAVTNQDAAYGGTDVDEPIEGAIARARKDLREITRAVTAADYEHLALACPGVKLARVKALEMYHPSHEDRVNTVVSVVIVPESKSNNPQEMAAPTHEEIALVREHLENYRIMGTELFVISPEYIRVKVETEVARDLRYMDSSVEANVKESLARFLKPAGGGGPDGNGWPFGRPVYLSEVEQVIDGAIGVDHVIKCRLYRWMGIEDQQYSLEDDSKITIPPHSLVYSIDDHIVTISQGGE